MFIASGPPQFLSAPLCLPAFVVMKVPMITTEAGRHGDRTEKNKRLFSVTRSLQEVW
jgi:hypothetical protein